MSDKQCGGCGEQISRQQEHLSVPELNRFYHHNCLTCYGCRDALKGPFSLWENTEPMCDRCLEERSPRCEECGYPVADMKVKTKFGYFHPACFVCSTCKFPFINDPDKSYFNVGGRVFCQHDAIEETKKPLGAGINQETVVRDA